MPLGLGSCYVAAASVSSRTDAVSVAVSKSSTVRMFDDGEVGNGTDLISEPRRTNPVAALLVLSASLSSKNLEKATEAGADEIRDKFATPGEFVGALRHLGTGE